MLANLIIFYIINHQNEEILHSEALNDVNSTLSHARFLVFCVYFVETIIL